LVQLIAHYHLRVLYIDKMLGTHVRMNQLDLIIKEYLPNLHQRFLQLDIKASMFASGWFLTMFATDLPLDVVFRIYDNVLLEGTDVLFNFALALLKRSQADLLKLPTEAALELLKEKLYEKFVGPDDLVEEAFKFKFSAKKLERIEKEARGYFDSKSEEEKRIQSLTQENAQLELEVETYRALYSAARAKNKQLEEDTDLTILDRDTMRNEIKVLVWAPAVFPPSLSSFFDTSSPFLFRPLNWKI